MKALEYKIFDVFTERITVSEFENWLYTNDELLSNLDSNPYYFDLFTINYSNDEWNKKLLQVTNEKHGEDFMIFFKLIEGCKKLSKANNFDEAYLHLNVLLECFDYQTEYDILWDFYLLREDFENFQFTIINKNELINKVRKLSNTTLNLMNSLEDLKSIKLYFLNNSKPKTAFTLVENKNKICTIQKKLILRIKALLFKKN